MVVIKRRDKIFLTGFGISVWFCPNCKNYIKTEFEKYCSHCGEKIMWEN